MGRHSQAVLIIAVIAGLLAGSARRSAAQSKLDQARKRFEQGEAYFKAGTFDKAIEEYSAAYALVPRPALLFNIGLCHEQLGDTANAVAYYERYLAAAPTGGKAPEATARREALVRKLDSARSAAERAALAARERSAGVRALGAGDYSDAVARLTASYELAPDPEVLFELAEAYHGKGDDILAVTTYRRYLSASTTGAFRDQASERLREIDQRRAEAQAAAAAQPVVLEGQPGARGSFKPAIIAVSAAGVAAAAGIVFGLQRRSKLSELDDELATGTPPLDSSDPRFDDDNTTLYANISFGVAGVAAVTGAVLAVYALQRRPRARATGEAVVVPAVGAEQVGVSLEVVW